MLNEPALKNIASVRTLGHNWGFPAGTGLWFKTKSPGFHRGLCLVAGGGFEPPTFGL